MSNVIIYPERLSASVLGKEFSAKTPTELYVTVMADILMNYPQIIGQKETHFTSDAARAGQYTGTTRSIDVNGRTIFIKTGFSTKDKWKGIEKTCQLAGLTFELSEESSDDFWSDDLFSDINVYEADKIIDQSCQTESSTFVPTSPFAFHSEYYVDKRDHICSCARFDEIAYCDGRIYVDGCFFHDFCRGSYNGHTVFEIKPDDWSIRAIVSDNKYFTGNVAVNKHGIFRIDGNKFYLFDMNGNMKSKVAIKPATPSGMYIYDSKIYSLSAKGSVYEYDILNSKSGKIIWSISDIRNELNVAVSSYLLDNNLERRYNNQMIQFSISLLTPKRICANDKRIVVGFELELNSKQIYAARNNFMLYVSIDAQSYKWNIIDISDARAECKVFSFDMEKDIMWWWTGDSESKHLFSAEIKPLDSFAKINPQYSYHLSAEFNGGYSSLSSLNENLYFDGKSVSGINNMHTVYLCADGTSKSYYDLYQCWDNYILGDWMYRPNMGQKIYADHHICFIPHKKESFDSSSEWHKIDRDEFEAAYQKAVKK